jgi:hypothetical protein
MGTSVFDICEILEISSWFVNEIMILEMIYIACDLFTNLETFSSIIDFQKKCYGKYTPKVVFCGWFIYTKYHTNSEKSQLF